MFGHDMNRELENAPLCSCCHGVASRILQKNISFNFVRDNAEVLSTIDVPGCQVVFCDRCGKESLDKFSTDKIVTASEYVSKLRSDVCWICRRNLPDSAEHKFKSSIFKKQYGRSFRGKMNRPIHFRNARYGVARKRDQTFQGVNSKILRFKPSICSNCNNNVTQQADRTFDQLYDFIQVNSELILTQKRLDLSQCFGITCQSDDLDLLRYFAKLLGCSMRDAGFEPTDFLGDFVLGRPIYPAIICEIYLHDEIVNLGVHKGYLGYSGLQLASNPTRFQQDMMVCGLVFSINYFPDIEGRPNHKSLTRIFELAPYSNFCHPLGGLNMQ